MELVEPKVWIKDVLKGTNAFLTHVKPVENVAPTPPISKQDNTSSNLLISKIPPEYADFADVFSKISVYILPEHKNHDYAIDLIDKAKQPLYGPIYNLSETELAVLQVYIDLHLKTGFIRPSKSLAEASILFAKKPDGGFQLCIDYRGLNNLTIKNRYPLPLVGESLDRLGQAQKFTKIDFT